MKVIVTGDFDNWSQSVELVPVDGVFEAEIPAGVFKFVVDGEWKVSQDYEVVTDEQGNQNNILRPEEPADLKPDVIEKAPVVEEPKAAPAKEVLEPIAQEAEKVIASVVGSVESVKKEAIPSLAEAKSEVTVDGNKKKKSFFDMFKKEKKEKKVVLEKGEKGPIFRRVSFSNSS
ncbi:hypothetical protein HK103_006095 [Boothiomyces macroporosus]|uniref:AMP-activated protein kinase glycogen-binding domain-containing protein n=1 Tax=Boothiomyces macroporosus TaxID=261099 RepID=A0AAD5Y4X4_9FUNG|nr:hypothetical protein HK103_006095 [Boothiomyces macroporosus]